MRFLKERPFGYFSLGAGYVMRLVVFLAGYTWERETRRSCTGWKDC